MKKLILLLLCAAILLTTASCADAPQTETATKNGYTFTDSEGTAVALEEKPQKVAILFSSYADIWVTAGGKADITVGESVERGFADQNAVLVDSGSGHSVIDMETLVAEQPDIVIGTTDYECQRKTIELCRSANIPAALFQVESFDDYLNLLKIFCDLTGNEQNYQKYGVEVKEKIDSMLNSLSEKDDAKKILFVRAGSSAKSTKAKTTDDNFVCKMLSQLGTINIADSDSTLTDTLSIETIIEQNPDYLFISTMGDETAAKDYFDSQLTSAGWNMLKCVENKHYCYLPKNLFHYKPNSRWAEAYEYLISILYPEK